MAVERRIGHQVLARLEHHAPLALGPQRRLDRVEHEVGPEPDPLDIGPGEEAERELGHARQHAGSPAHAGIGPSRVASQLQR